MAEFIRPEIARLVRVFLPSAVVLAAGVWLLRLGGYVLGPLGAVLAVTSALLAVIEWRRFRLGDEGDPDPGIIELSEGVLRYWAPDGMGGEVALRDLVEIRLVMVNRRANWRLRAITNEALLLPVNARGADVLADAFATLPAMDLGVLVQARRLAGRGDAPLQGPLWRHPDAAGDLTLPRPLANPR